MTSVSAGAEFRGSSRNPAAATDATAVLDAGHAGDIVGAFGRIRRDGTDPFRGRWGRLRTLMVITGPGLIVMVGDNDAGGVATYAQAGQNYGMGLLWALTLLIPVLYVNQEMVLRLGAVTRVGHARLIFARFGRFWGAFSVGDLLVLNALTIVTEFIGVSMALGFLGCPKSVAIPSAAALLFALVAGGSFRRWEALMFLLIAVNILIIPMVLLVHPTLNAGGLIPQFPGGLNSTVLLLVVAIVGTTVAPWQLFFQQSNVVDKRITARWIPYARADLVIGIVVVMVGATALMAVAVFGLAGTADAGNFTDAGAVASILAKHVGATVGTLFAIILLDASLIGANAIGLATTYAIGDAMSRRHSLHWKVGEAPLFYGGYALLLAVSAAVAFSPDHILGLGDPGRAGAGRCSAALGNRVPRSALQRPGATGPVDEHPAPEHHCVDHRVVIGAVVAGVDGDNILPPIVRRSHRGGAGGGHCRRHRRGRHRNRRGSASQRSARRGGDRGCPRRGCGSRGRRTNSTTHRL